MSSQTVPIHRTNTDSSTSNKNDIWFNAFNFAPGQDENIRWLSRPNQQSVQYSSDTEKFRITFDVENFKADQIKIYIQCHKLTISGVYEERSEGHFMQKQFERTFDLPANADVDAMASFITSTHMLVVEIPLNPSPKADCLNINSNRNDQRRLSFSLNKFNTSNNQGLLSSLNDSSNLSTSGQQIRRTSITKTTTTTSTGSSAIPPEAAELLKSVDTTTGSNTHTSSTYTTDRHSSNTGNQLVSNEPNTSSSTTSNKQTTLTSSELANLPVDFPPELLASGGTITIHKRKVSVTRETDGNTDYGVSAPLTQGNNTESTSSTTTNSTHSTNQTGSVPITRSNDIESKSSTTTNSTHSTNQTGSVPITRNNDTQSTSSTTTNNTSSNTLNQQQLNTIERHNLKTISSNNQSRMYTLEEFLQNKTWNPTLIDGSDAKKILYMRLQMQPGTTLNQMQISLNGYDLRVEVDSKTSTECGRKMSSQSYRQVTLFSTCEVDQLKTELKDDGYLHIQVPIKL